MCGIVGYIGHRQVVPVLIDGLKRLEYRGYDSAGIALICDGKLDTIKRKGKIKELEKELSDSEQMRLNSFSGIAHTRWATHGEPSDINAHPHTDCTGKIAVVHNGIIENYRALRQFLESKGHQFTTDTDTEIIAHLFEEMLKMANDFEEAFRLALLEIEGTYGLGVIYSEQPNKIYAARHGSPLLIGAGKNENLIASDPTAVIRYTDRVIYLDEGEYAILSDKDFVIKNLQRKRIEPRVEKITFSIQELEKGGYPHFMLKEIYEQPQTLQNAYRGRLNIDEGTARLNGLKPYHDILAKAKRIVITACGTSWHSALIGEYLIEELARIPVETEYASEFRYRSPILSEDTPVIAISQSGETADTLAALREAKIHGAKTFGIVNVVGSTIARETDAGVYIHAGPEIGVASTKAFTSQVMVLSLLSILLARMRGLSTQRGRQLVEELSTVPAKVESILMRENKTKEIKRIAEHFQNHSNFLYLGRSYNFPVALEGALKLKEISYIHAEGYPAAEMKHGPIALIDENMPVVFIATDDPLYQKIVTNIEEVRSRGGKVIVVATEGNEDIKELADHIIYIPQISYIFTPILSVIPLQLLAYHIAVLRGCDVDQPRNLAKSVTVE
ncbi:glutamine--fructose-6-phosphate transaminase (isomerizing) [bacterium]|nr:MAG: glutamine--fructose-6-phosphate transaminase (isomerizing) [bacterium]